MATRRIEIPYVAGLVSYACAEAEITIREDEREVANTDDAKG